MFGRTGTHYYAFDLLMLDTTDLRPLPLETRKEALRQLTEDCDPVRYCDYVVARGKAFFNLVREAVVVRQPEVEHRVRVKDFERWLESSEARLR